METSENDRFSDVFWGCKKETPGSNGLTTIILIIRPYLLQEMLKHLNMDYRPVLTWLQKFWKLPLWMNSRPKSKFGS